ncbi:uncharacterized protein LOC129572865 [Sitodiplosis mosellana]|uniref:uncharacterized protein LOC129572865 n=1 Tax=Sitodiplosis mosellana TaxID=263140 RepID=UPI0024437D43|nr:uncharacterized protein LOC129572865 [Sitodiplosis mosellana]
MSTTANNVSFREGCQAASVFAMAGQFFMLVERAPLPIYFHLFICANLLAHFTWLYGSFNYKKGIMVIPLIWFIITEFAWIVIFYQLYTNSAGKVFIFIACFMTGFFIFAALGTHATIKRTADESSTNEQTTNEAPNRSNLESDRLNV